MGTYPSRSAPRWGALVGCRTQMASSGLASPSCRRAEPLKLCRPDSVDETAASIGEPSRCPQAGPPSFRLGSRVIGRECRLRHPANSEAGRAPTGRNPPNCEGPLPRCPRRSSAGPLTIRPRLPPSLSHHRLWVWQAAQPRHAPCRVADGSDHRPIRERQRFFDIDPEIADRALDLGVPEQDLHGAQVGQLPRSERRFARAEVGGPRN